MAIPGSRRTFVVAAIFSIAILLVACTAGFRAQLRRAESFERNNQPAKALAIYDTVLPLLQHSNAALISDVQYHRGNCLWDMGRAADAFSAFNKSLEANAGNLNARLKLAEIFLAGSAPESAIENAQIVQRSQPNNAAAAAVIGEGYAALGRGPEALAELRKAMQLDPSVSQIAVALADIYNALDQVDEARNVLRRSAQANPTHADAWLALGRLEEQVGDNRAADVAYRNAVKAEDTPRSNMRLAQFLQRTAQTREAEETLRRVDSMQPLEPSALADFELMSGHAANAERHYAGALQPTSTAPGKAKGNAPNPQAAERSGIITRLIESEIAAATDDPPSIESAREKSNPNLDRARRHLDQYRAELDPASIGVLEAEISLAAGEIPAAVLHAQGALAVSPQSAATHYVLGLARARQGERALARSEWLLALDADNAYAPARIALASVALEQNAPDDAVEFVTPVVRAEPGNLLALIVYSRALTGQKRYDAAETVARRAVAVDPRSQQPHLVLGEIALAQKNLSQSLLEFEQAVLLQPHAPDAIDGLTRVYRQGKVTRPMLLHMEEVGSAPPQSTTLLEITGRLFADRGWNADAERCLRRTLELDPNRTTAAAALGRVLASQGKLDPAAQVAALPHPESAALVAGIKAQDSGDYRAAIREYEFAIRHGEHTGVAANNLAWIYAHQGTRLDRALTLASSAHDMLPDSPAVMDTIGVVHLARREYTKGVESLELARRLLLRLSADDPQRTPLTSQIDQHLAEAYLRSGRSDAAAKLSR